MNKEELIQKVRELLSARQKSLLVGVVLVVVIGAGIGWNLMQNDVSPQPSEVANPGTESSREEQGEISHSYFRIVTPPYFMVFSGDLSQNHVLTVHSLNFIESLSETIQNVQENEFEEPGYRVLLEKNGEIFVNEDLSIMNCPDGRDVCTFTNQIPGLFNFALDGVPEFPDAIVIVSKDQEVARYPINSNFPTLRFTKQEIKDRVIMLEWESDPVNIDLEYLAYVSSKPLKFGDPDNPGPFNSITEDSTSINSYEVRLEDGLFIFDTRGSVESELFVTLYASNGLTSTVGVSGPFVVDLAPTTEEVTEFERQLKVGQAMEFNGIKLTLITIIEDSRCPIDVRCIRAGELKLEVQLQSNNETLNKVLSSNLSDPFIYQDHSIEITHILPKPISTVQLNNNDYLITLRVNKL